MVASRWPLRLAPAALMRRDLEQHWRTHKTKILDVLADKYPQAYFAGLVTLSKVIRWEVGMAGEFDRSLTPDEIMVKLEQRVGPEGRKLFEKLLRDVNKADEAHTSRHGADIVSVPPQPRHAWAVGVSRARGS